MPLLPTGRSRVIKIFSSRSQSKTSWPPLQYTDYAYNRKNTLQALVASYKNGMASYLRRRGGHEARVGKLSRVAGHKQTLQGMAGRTNFPPTIPVLLLL